MKWNIGGKLKRNDAKPDPNGRPRNANEKSRQLSRPLSLPQNPPQFPVTRVKWQDSSYEPGWKKEFDSSKSHEIVSVGFVLFCDKDKLVLASTIAPDDGAFLNYQTIPMGCVREMEVIK